MVSCNIPMDKTSNLPVNSLLLGIVVWGIRQLNTARPNQNPPQFDKDHKPCLIQGLSFWVIRLCPQNSLTPS